MSEARGLRGGLGQGHNSHNSPQPPAGAAEVPKAAPDSAPAGGEAAKPCECPPLQPIAFPGHGMPGSAGGGFYPTRGRAGDGGVGGPPGGSFGVASPLGNAPSIASLSVPPIDTADVGPPTYDPVTADPPPMTAMDLPALAPVEQGDARDTVAAVPKPASLVPLGLDLLGLAAARRFSHARTGA